VVEFHGGSIGLRPSTLGGTCVSFTLPMERESVEDAPAAAVEREVTAGE
jgi:signal transduction histidine kinase